MTQGPLGDYLNDHLAGAAFGTDLARQLVRRAKGTPLEGALDGVALEIAEDRQTLRDLMERMKVTKNPIKQAATWLGEKGSRVGLTVAALGSDRHFGLFLGLESLLLGVEGKATLWATLQALTDRYPELAALDLGALEARARGQRDTIETARITAGRLALAN
jgi:hypothetical protein